MKNGFTLIELLAVIVILGLIAAIFVPSANNILKENETRLYSVKEGTIKRAASDYVLEKKSDGTLNLPTVDNIKYIPIDYLISNNNTGKILDSTSGNECVGYVKVTENVSYDYNYDVCLICDDYITDDDSCTREIWNNIRSVLS